MVAVFEVSTLPFEPMVVITPMQIVTINANMIAYSTAVGPSSFLMNPIAAWINFRTTPLPLNVRAAHQAMFRQAIL
jgi:hypothetical protein